MYLYIWAGMRCGLDEDNMNGGLAEAQGRMP